MPRKRMIDPGIWTDPDMMLLSTPAFVTFIAIFSLADDEGITDVTPQSLYFRMARQDVTQDQITAALDDLELSGIIIRYDEGHLAWLSNWFEYQNLRGRKPYLSHHKRPPKSILERHPDYIQEWEKTFADKAQAYPWHTCFDAQTTTSLPVAHQLHTGCTPAVDPCDNRFRISKGSKVKGREVGCPPSSAKQPANNSEISEVAWSAFERIHGPIKIDADKEREAVTTLVANAQTRGDPVEILPKMIATLKLLQTEETGRRRYWRDMPFLPRSLVSHWAEVWHVMNARDKPDPEAIPKYVPDEEEERMRELKRQGKLPGQQPERATGEDTNG